MNKDFKKNTSIVTTNPLDNSLLNNQGTTWMLGGVAIGLMVGLGMYYVSKSSPQVEAKTQSSQTSKTLVSQQVEQQLKEDNIKHNKIINDKIDSYNDKNEIDTRPGFSYHAVLPNLEVGKSAQKKMAKDAERKVVTTKPLIEKQTIVADYGNKHSLQVGSFRSMAQAQKAQQRINRKGMSPNNIQKANVDGTTWFRVRLGPTSNPAIFQNWKTKLASMGVSVIVVK